MRNNTAIFFDLDGTVTSEEILPLLAQEIDIYEEMEALTIATIRGHIPFEKSFKLRIKLLRELSISKASQIVMEVKLQTEIVEFIQENRQRCYIVTGNLDVYIGRLMEKLGFNYYCAKASYEEDRLHGIKQLLDKGAVVDELKKEYARIIVVGDGMNDVPMFEKGDIKIAYGGVHAPVETLIQMSDYVTYDQKGLCQLLNTL